MLQKKIRSVRKYSMLEKPCTYSFFEQSRKKHAHNKICMCPLKNFLFATQNHASCCETSTAGSIYGSHGALGWDSDKSN